MSRWGTALAAALLLALPGTGVAQRVRMTQETEDDARKRHIDEISAALAEKLPSLQKLLETRRYLLQQSTDGPAYSASAVESLLSDVERPLLAALEHEDVAALRDMFILDFAKIRSELNLSRAAAAGGHGIQLVAFRWGEPAAGAGTVDRAATESRLDWLLSQLKRLFTLATDRDLAVDLCAVSQPTGAAFVMNAPSLPEKPYGTQTVGSVSKVSRGYYGFKLTKQLTEKSELKTECPAPRPGDRWSCPPIDLWDDSRPVWECDLSQKACRRREREK